MRARAFCLGAVLAVAGMAILTTSPALATTTELCSEAVYPCEGARYPAKTEIKANLKAGSEAVFKGSITVACKASTISGLTLAEEGTPLKVEVTGMTFSKCSGCEAVEATALPWSGNIEEVEVVEAGDGNGALTLTSQSLVLSKCSGNKCTEEAPGMVLDVIGGEKAEVLAKEEKVKVSGGFCGTSSSFTASYEVTQPAPMFVGPRKTELCHVAPAANGNCPAGEAYKLPRALEAWAMDTRFTGFSPEKNCAEVGLAGEAEGALVVALEGRFSKWEFPSGCEGCSVVAEAGGLGYFPITIRASGGGNGRLVLQYPKLKFTCGGNNCVYEKPIAVLEFIGGFVGAIRANGSALDASCGGTWPASVQWFGEYLVNSPLGVYVTR